MPTNTFENLSTVTVSGTLTTTVTFSSINTSTYRHFILLGFAAMNSTADTLAYRVNGDSGANYIWNAINVGGGNNTTPVPTQQNTSDSFARIGYYSVPATQYRGQIFRVTIPNPRSGYVQALSDSFQYSLGSVPYFMMNNTYWAGTMTSLSVTTYGGSAFRAGSIFSLYGVI
jgi:hypothetical protein